MSSVVVPVANLSRQTAFFAADFHRKIDEIFARGMVIFGPEHEAFEKEFAAYTGVAHCIAVANGTDALELGLKSLGCVAGDEVITVSNAGFYSSAAIIACGAVPVYADIDPATLTMAPDALAALMTPRTRAIIVTHLYGKLADMEAIMRIARQANVPVLEDCAQSHGAQRGGKKAGSFGEVATFSFYPTKNLGAVGDGGAVVTSSDERAARLRQLRQYGWEEKYTVGIAHGRNSRLDEIQAAMLRLKLPHLEGFNAKRRAIAARYRAVLAEAGKAEWMPHAPQDDYVAHLCIVCHPQRDSFKERLAKAGVGTAVHYPVCDHEQKALQSVPWRAGSLASTEQVNRTIVTLPCFPEMTEEEISRVCHALKECL